MQFSTYDLLARAPNAVLRPAPEDAGERQRPTPITRKLRQNVSVDPVEQLLRLALHIKAGILMGFATGERGDALHEIEDRFGRATFLGKHGLDDLAGFCLGKAASAQEIAAILVRSSDDSLTRCPDAVDEGLPQRA